MSKFSYPIINTFNDVVIIENTKPLIICDIDHTFLRPKNDFKFYYNLASDRFDDEAEITDLARNLSTIACCFGLIKQTDEEGFVKLLERIRKQHGKLIFLTARGADFNDKTIEDLINVGLKNPETYAIHYTNALITKGEYIRINNLHNGYDHISFIDDYTCYLDSVYELFPHINCYQFKHD